MGNNNNHHAHDDHDDERKINNLELNMNYVSKQNNNLFVY